jgi:small basic protein (TIGR04137 family)
MAEGKAGGTFLSRWHVVLRPKIAARRGTIIEPLFPRGDVRRIAVMTMDKSLKVRLGLARARSVLTRAERIQRLKAADRWKEGESPFGLAKVRVYKLAVKKKKKKKEEEGAEGVEAAAAAPAEGAKKEAGKKEAGKKEAGKK